MKTIYLLSDPRDNAPRYVGITKDIKHRLSQHLRDKNKTHRCSWIGSLRILGLTPLIEVLEEVEDGDGYITEIAWILGFRIAGYSLTNMTMGGDGVTCLSGESRDKMRRARLGRKASPETLEKMRLASLGRTHTCDFKEKMRKRMIGNKFGVGRKASLETRAKMSASGIGHIITPDGKDRLSKLMIGNKRGLGNKSKTGHVMSEETRSKMSASRMGHVVTQASRDKISKGNLGKKKCLGCKRSPETIEKMRSAAIRRGITPETREKMRVTKLNKNSPKG